MELKDYMKTDPEMFWILSPGEVQNLLDEAIEEIQRLRGALQQIATLEVKIEGITQYNPSDFMRDIAEKTLKE